MAHLLPRAVLVIAAWAMICVLIRRLWPGTDPIVFGVFGACWISGAVAYFGYLRKLRRDIEELERSCGFSVD